MKKLKLNFESHRVESFETTSSNLKNKGTAKGFICDEVLTVSLMPTCVNCQGEPTCWPTLAHTCPESCRGTCFTCGHPTCDQTCGETCAPTPQVCGPDPVYDQSLGNIYF